MNRIFITLAFGWIAVMMWAVPANPRPMDYVQPNGDTITIRLVGDEHFHFHTTVDGMLIAKDAKGYYCYAKWTEQEADGKRYWVAKPTGRKAHNADKRRKCEQRWVTKQAKKNQKRRNK